jgi:cation transport ATPase
MRDRVWESDSFSNQGPSEETETTMFLELSKAFSFFLSILSLYPIALSAFFVPGSRWQERLTMSLLKIALAACVCFASGFLFSWSSQTNPEAGQSLISTLPVRLFFWAMAGMAILFVISWYLEEYYVPFLWKNQL